MKRPQDYIYEAYNKVEKVYKATFIAAMLIGILAHGYMFFNKFSFHDDVANLFSNGTTIGSGRWGLEVAYLFNIIFLNANSSMPVINGIVSLFFIALSACVVVKLFDVKSCFYGSLIGSVMAAFPAVASTFIFMFTAPYYFGALFFTIFAAYLIIKKRSCLFGAFLFALSLSLYQPYIVVAFTLFVLYFIFERLKNVSIKEDMKWIVRYALSVIIGALLWGGLNTVWKIFYHMPLQQEGRMAKVSGITIQEVLRGIAQVYQKFFSLIYTDYKGLSNGHGIRIIYASIFLLMAIKVILTLRCFRMSRLNKVLYFVAVLLLPLAIGFMEILSTVGIYVHTLTLYSYVFIWAGSIISLDGFGKYVLTISSSEKSACLLRDRVLLIFQWTVFLVIAWCLIFYIRLDNMAYLKVDFTQRQADSYYTVLVTQIKSADGYRDDMPVAVLRSSKLPYELNDRSMYSKNWYGKVTIYGAEGSLTKWITDVHWKLYLENHCGFSPEYIEDTTGIEAMEEVRNMPCYPDEGSVKVIDGMVVVNLKNDAE